MNALFCSADCHLGKRLRNRKMFFRDSYDAFTEMCTKIIKHPADKKALALAGDVCENNYVTGESLEVLADNIDRLYNEGIRVYSIMGNHDLGDKSILATQGAVDINEKLVDVCGYKVYGLDYRPPEILHDIIEDVPECDVLFLHQAFQHLMGIEGVYDLSINHIPDQVKHVFCGDIHVRNVKEISDGRYFISPGSLHPTKMDENKEHGFAVFDGSWDFIPITTRQILRGTINTEEDFDEFCEELKSIQMKPAPVVDIKCEKKLHGKVEEIRKQYEEKTCFIVNEFIDTETITVVTENSLTSTMADKLPQAVDKDNNETQYSFCYRLLTEDFNKVVEDKVKEWDVELEED